VGPVVGDVTSEEHDPAARRLVKTCEHVEERRLSGAVWTNDRDDRPGRDVDRDSIDGDETAELLAHLLGGEDRWGLGVRCPGLGLDAHGAASPGSTAAQAVPG